VDVHAFMLAMLGEAEAHDAMFVSNSRVERISRADGLWQVHLPGEAEAIASAPILVNSAGLEAQHLASATEGLDPVHVPHLHLARGVYFGYGGTVPFTHLVYPVPEPGGLGVHLTLDLAGRARFGPDVEWIDAVDYSIDESRKPAFVAGARRIWNGIDPDKLYADYSGIRPKLSGPGMPAGDFVISGPEAHRCPGLVNLFGIESPGITSSLAIGELVMEMLNS
jgi:L-2-hydroxyglutarate oxidase LhgO